MRAYRVIFRNATLVLALASLLSAVEAGAAGFYNLPSNGRQCLGYGVGPGYHADLLLGPSYKSRTASGRIRRVRAPFHPSQAPPVMADFGAMSTWRGPQSNASSGW